MADSDVPRPSRPNQNNEPVSFPLDAEGKDSSTTSTKKKTLVAGAIVLVLVLAGGAAAWYKFPRPNAEVAAPNETVEKAEQAKAAPPSETAKSLTGEQVYRRLLRSTVFILIIDKNARGDLFVSCGSGVLVHKTKGLVVTNYHVVEEEARVSVFFPANDPKGELITDPANYVKEKVDQRIWAKVVARDARRDLAVLQLDQVPDLVVAAPLASKPAGIGTTVYSVGASGVNLKDFSGALWRLSTGTVRGRYKDSVTYQKGQKVEAMFLETQKPINPGDSGGPTVNDRGELVGVVSASDPRKDLVKLDIDLTEIRGYLAAHAEKNGWAWQDATTGGSVTFDEAIDVKKLVAELQGADAAKRLDAVKRLAALGPDARQAIPELLLKLDDSDERVRRAANEALEKIGPPAKADVGSIDAALRSGRQNARLFALLFYSDPARKVPEPLLSEVVKALADPSAETRKTAIRALNNYGPGCKIKALAALLDRIADEDSTVATEAARVFASFAPFDEKERQALIGGLVNAKASVRLAAVSSLASDVPDATSALKWFQPRVADMDPRVRAKAVELLAKWGPKAKACLPDLLARLDDDTPAIAVAAVKAVAVVDGGSMVVEAFGRLLKSADARAEVKNAAAEALLALDLSSAETDVPILVLLLVREKAETRVAALAKLAKFGKGAKSAFGSITNRLKDEDAGVKLAAMKALATFGNEGADAIPSVAELLDGKQTDAVAVEAATTLPKLGPKAIEPLTKALSSKLPKDALVQVCEGLGSFGKDARTAGPALLEAVNNQADLRVLAGEAIAAALAMNPWTPDPVSAALSKVGGGDKVATELTEWTTFELKVIMGVNRRVAKKGDGVMLWAILALNSIEPDSLTMKVKDQVVSQLGILGSYAPTQVCKDAAKVAQKKFAQKK